MIKLKETALRQMEKTSVGKRIAGSQRYRIVLAATLALAVNLMYALYNGVLGLIGQSLWLVTMCAYYTILSVMRFSAVLLEKKNASVQDKAAEWFAMRFSGILLMVLSLVLAGSVYLSLTHDVAAKYHEIVMITMATYTFTKVILAIINIVKVRKKDSPLLTTMRSISCADAAASILTLQRSMLVSFGEMSRSGIHDMNAMTGGAVCLFILLLGAGMALKKTSGKGK